MRKGQALSLLFFGLIVLALTAAKVDTQSALGRLNLSVIVPAQVTLQQETKSYQSAQSYFQTRCVMCHGKGGAGDGAMAAHLNPRPKAFTAQKWQADTTDEQIAKIIVGGGGAVGKSAAMPPNYDLKNQPELLKGLIRLVRSFGNSGTVRVKVVKKGGAGPRTVYKSAKKPGAHVAEFRFADLQPGMYEITGQWEHLGQDPANKNQVAHTQPRLMEHPFRQLVEVKAGQVLREEIHVKTSQAGKRQ